MTSPDPKRVRTAPKFTGFTRPIRLHPACCTESAEDLQRMRDLIKEDPSLLNDFRRSEDDGEDRYFIHHLLWPSYIWPQPAIFSPPLWHACRAQHPRCVQLILQASGPENVKHIEKLTFHISPISYVENILSYTIVYGNEDKKSCEIMKLLLEHGVSPNLEIPVTEISNPQLLQVLEQYRATKLVFPFISNVSNLAVEKGYSKVLKLLFEHGAYPDPVILSETGSILPLYPTLNRHLNPIPAIEHPDFLYDPELSWYEKTRSVSRHLKLHKIGLSAPLLTQILYYDHVCMKHVEAMKTLLVHGALLPPYFIKLDNNEVFQVFSQVLFAFDAIIHIGDRFMMRRMYAAREYPSTWGVQSDGTWCRYHDVILEILKLYHQFGGSLWWKMKSSDVPCEGGKGECVEWLRDPARVTPCKSIIDMLREHIPDPDAQSMVVEEVQRMMSTPPSLQHAARQAIRRSMGYGCVRNLEALPLPNDLKKYLKFETE